MRNLRIEPATADDLRVLAADLHPASAFELRAFHGKTISLADQLIATYEGRGEIVFSPSGRPAAVFGVFQATPAVVRTGFVAGRRFGDVAVPFARYVKRVVWPGVFAVASVRRIECVTIAKRPLARLFGLAFESERPESGVGGEAAGVYSLLRGGARRA